MISNTLYSLFFCLINLLIYLRLEKSFQFEKAPLLYVLIFVFITAHFGFVQIENFMPAHEFYDLIFFSVGLIILHYGTNFQVMLLKKHSILKYNENQKSQENVLRVFDFMRQKLIYILITAYQILAIWNPRFR